MGVVKDGVWFPNKQLADQWKIRKEWNIVLEKVFDEKYFNVPEVVKVLKDLNLMNSWTMSKPSVSLGGA